MTAFREAASEPLFSPHPLPVDSAGRFQNLRTEMSLIRSLMDEMEQFIPPSCPDLCHALGRAAGWQLADEIEGLARALGEAAAELRRQMEALPQS